ncbi:MAG: hypothetical protein JWM10_705 [Myxococcaceae bacterium]|nr:hypothetical protein [Myxococcaceae bacterium]
MRDTLGAVSRDDGEVFTFAPDVDAVVSWLSGAVPFQIPLGAPAATLGDLVGDLVDDWATILGAEQRCADPMDLRDAEPLLDVNDHFNHQLSVCVLDGVLASVSYRLHSWTLGDDPYLLSRGRELGYVGDDGAVLPRYDNRRFRALLERVLPAAGFPLRAAPPSSGKKERGGLRLTWRRRQETNFDSLELDLLASRS